MFGKDHDEDDKIDYYNGPDLPDPEKKEKKPVLQPDDPRYWDQEESEWEHLHPAGNRKNRVWWWLAGIGILIGLGIGIYLRYFAPCVEEATQYGYVESIDKRGTIFKTYEGILIPYRELMDTTRVYQRDFMFTAENPEVAARLRMFLNTASPVKVSYKQYHATLPWRGSNKIIVTGVEQADASKILPPEFTPAPDKEKK